MSSCATPNPCADPSSIRNKGEGHWEFDPFLPSSSPFLQEPAFFHCFEISYYPKRNQISQVWVV
jgi:hypothetical protein